LTRVENLLTFAATTDHSEMVAEKVKLWIDELAGRP